MTIRNLQTLTDYATLTAAVAALPNPLDQDYVLEDQDQATYSESTIYLNTLDTATFRLTIQGRPGLRPTFDSPTGGGGKGSSPTSFIQVSNVARRVTLRDLYISDGFVSFANIGGVNAHEVDRCIIHTTEADAINLNDLGLGPGGGVPAALVTNSVLHADSGPASFNSGIQAVAYHHCTFSSFSAAPPEGGDAVIFWLPQAGTDPIQFRNCIFRHSDKGITFQGIFWTTDLGLTTIDSDGNLFHRNTVASNLAWNQTSGSAVATLANWQAATGGDASSSVLTGAFPDAAMYADEAALDLSPVSGATSIDAVPVAYEGLSARDLENVARPVNAISDIGAYEFSGGGGGPPTPEVTDSVSLDGTEIEVTFSEEMDPADLSLTNAASYTLETVTGAAPATVTAVRIGTLGPGLGALTVILTTSGTTLGGTYITHVVGPTSLLGVAVADVDVPFLTRGDAPTFAVTIPQPDTGDALLLTFDQDMLPTAEEPGAGAGIEDIASYVFQPSISFPVSLVATSATLQTDPTQVLLSVEGMTSLDYTLTVGPAFAFSYDVAGGIVNATRVDTGTGTAVESGSNLVVGRTSGNAFGLEWQDTSGTITPLLSSIRMDCQFDFSNAGYTPAIGTFPTPSIAEISFQDGLPVSGLLATVTLQYNGGVGEIRLQSGTYDVTVTAVWDDGPHTLSFVRNQKSGYATFVLDGFPLTSVPIASLTGVPVTTAGIGFSLLTGGWDLSGVRVQDIRASSSTTVYSQAWNFLHDGTDVFTGSPILAQDTILTQRGPLVRGWGDAPPATTQDVTVRVAGVEVSLAAVNPYMGSIQLAIPLPLLPAGDPRNSVQVDYQWFKSPVMEFAALNTPGLVLNQHDCPRYGHHDPAGHGDQIQDADHPKGAVDLHRFPMSTVIGPINRAKPLYIGHRYLGFEKSYSALTNSPETLLLNHPPGLAAIPGFERMVQGVSVAYEGLVRPVDAAPAWAIVGSDYGGVDHSAETGVDLGTFTVIDAKAGPFDPNDPQAVVYHRGVDLTAPSSIYLVSRFQTSNVGLFDDIHPNPGSLSNTLVSEGVFTGVGFGIHDNQKMYFCGALKINDVEHVGLLLNPRRPHETTSWSVGPKGILTAQSQTEGQIPTADVPIGFAVGSRFQVLEGPQTGVYTATYVSHERHGITQVEFSPPLPEVWDIWGQKFPEVFFETRTSSKPFTYRIDINTEDQVAELRISGETRGVVATVSGDAPLLPQPAASSLLIPMGGFGQIFWGSLSRQASSRATWSFARYGVVPDHVFLQGHVVAVNSEFAVLPELDTGDRWFQNQGFGESSLTGLPDSLLLKASVSSDILDFSLGYSRVEPFLSPEALFDIQASVSLDSGTRGSGDIEVSFDDTQRVAKLVPLLYQEGFAGETTYRRLINLPSVSTTGSTLPSTLGWLDSVGSTLVSTVEGSQLVSTQSSTAYGGWTKDLDWSIANAVATDEGRLFEARLAVTSYTANVSGDTGIRFGCQMAGSGGDAVVQIELRAGVTPGVRLRTATGAPIAEYDFDWTDGVPHTYRVLADLTAATVSVVIDDTVQLPVAAIAGFVGGTSTLEGYFGCYGVDASNVLDATISCTVEWHHYHCHVLPPATAIRTLGLWLGGDSNDINAFEIPRTDTTTAPNSWGTGPVIEPMDWRSNMEVRMLHDPGWGITVFRPDLAAPPYYTPEDGTAGTGFVTDSVEPSAGWINVEYRDLPLSPGTALGLVNFGSLNSMSLSQSRWDWVRYRMSRHPSEGGAAPKHMVLNQFNVVSSGEHTSDVGLEQVTVVTLDKARMSLIPTHLYAKSIYKIIDGETIWTSEDWIFDPISQTVTLQQDLQTGEIKEFSEVHANVTVYFIPGKPVTNTYLQNQPLLASITKLNEGTPPVPLSRTSEYASLEHIQVDDGGGTDLLSSICEGGPDDGLYGFSATEGEEVYSLTGGGASLGGAGDMANHFATGTRVGLAVGAEVMRLSGTKYWEGLQSIKQDQILGGGLGSVLYASGGSFTNPVVDALGNVIPGAVAPGGGVIGPNGPVLWYG